MAYTILKQPKTIYIIIILILSMISCSKYQKIMKSDDIEMQYNAAEEYYQNEDYYKASTLYYKLMNVYRGTEKAQNIYYKYAYCNFYMGDFITAGHYFRQFSKSFPFSKHAEESQFMGAYCHYLNSPISSLDQTSTIKAINELQLFINTNPTSDKADTCNILIDNLRKKMETKQYDISMLYYHTEDYKAAIVAFDNLLQRFPDTENKETIIYNMVKSKYRLAINSIESKKQERLEDALTASKKFLEQYPESEYKKEISNILNKTNKHIQLYLSTNTNSDGL